MACGSCNGVRHGIVATSSSSRNSLFSLEQSDKRSMHRTAISRGRSFATPTKPTPGEQQWRKRPGDLQMRRASHDRHGTLYYNLCHKTQDLVLCDSQAASRIFSRFVFGFSWRNNLAVSKTGCFRSLVNRPSSSHLHPHVSGQQWPELDAVGVADERMHNAVNDRGFLGAIPIVYIYPENPTRCLTFHS